MENLKENYTSIIDFNEMQSIKQNLGNPGKGEFLFQFDDDVPVLFAEDGGNLKIEISAGDGINPSIEFHSKDGKSFKIFGRLIE